MERCRQGRTEAERGKPFPVPPLRETQITHRPTLSLGLDPAFTHHFHSTNIAHQYFKHTKCYWSK